MSKRKAALGKENVDPDLADFREPKVKKAKAGSRFATPLSEVEIAEYSKAQLYRTPQRIRNGLFVYSLCGVERETRLLTTNALKTCWRKSHLPSD